MKAPHVELELAGRDASHDRRRAGEPRRVGQRLRRIKGTVGGFVGLWRSVTPARTHADAKAPRRRRNTTPTPYIAEEVTVHTSLTGLE
jgi:hypothetical protein